MHFLFENSDTPWQERKEFVVSFAWRKCPQSFRISTTLRIFLPTANCSLRVSTGNVLHPAGPSLLQWTGVIMNLTIFSPYKKEMGRTFRSNCAILCSTGIVDITLPGRTDKKDLPILIIKPFPFHFWLWKLLSYHKKLNIRIWES